MNMLDGTCYLEDFMPPKEKIEAIDTNVPHWFRFFSDRRRMEARHQEYAKELNEAGWEVNPPK